jgi:hypothetical protein
VDQAQETVSAVESLLSVGIAGQHANHTPGLKLLKRVGSFRHPEPLTRVPSGRLLLPLGSPLNGSGSSGGSHLSKMMSMRSMPVDEELSE